MTVFVIAMTLRVLEPLYLHVTTGYWGSEAYMSSGEERMDRLSGAPFDVVNPNGLAFVILTVLPFLHYLSFSTNYLKAIYLMCLPLLLWALILTGSRSGLLGLGAVFLGIWLKSRHKLLMLTIVMAAALLAIPALPDDLADRYLSIVDSNTKNGATASGRLSGLESDLTVALRRPLFGHGLGTSREANANFAGSDMPSHNLYTETAQEIGLVGLGILVLLIVTISADLRSGIRALRAASGANSFLLSVVDATQTWFWMTLLFSFASYGLTSYEWYFTAGLASVLKRLALELSVPVATPAVPVSAGVTVQVHQRRRESLQPSL